jgi:hypothetical protein
VKLKRHGGRMRKCQRLLRRKSTLGTCTRISVDNVELYKMAKKTTKWAVSEARGQMYDGLYQRLGTKEREKDIYRMAESRERKTRDIIQIKCMKDATEQLLTKDEDIKNRCLEYFDKLFNEDSGSSSIELEIFSDDLNRQFVRRIQESEIKDALKRMNGGKAMGPDGIPIEVWRSLGDVVIVWLTKLFNLMFRSNNMPNEWRRGILVPIFKNKGNVHSYTNYQGIKLMSHTMKLWARIIEHRLRGVTNVIENQFGLCKGDRLWRRFFDKANYGEM